MGLLSVGTPLSWEETKALADYVREHGIKQFIYQYRRLKERRGDCLKWGDEIEYVVVRFDEANRRVQVSLRGADILHKLMESEDHEDASKNAFLWRPEYAAYMIEGTPGVPYGGLLSCFNFVEDNMRRRRAEIAKHLSSGEVIFSIGNFPRLGCPDFTYPQTKPTPGEGVSHSAFFPDEVIYAAHPRFRTLTRNIRQRRGEKVAINVPIFRDQNTPTPFMEVPQAFGATAEDLAAAKPDHIYLDAMGFGMGCCCLQVTFQAVNVNEARWLYDQLTPITPIMLALSAATPIYRGYLSDVDCRWNIISGSTDDRTEEERGLKPLERDHFRINKSRYDTTDCYLYPCSAAYNDIDMIIDEKIYKELVGAGIDSLLAKHVAHLFIRDPIQLYKERTHLNDTETCEHFESIQSSNWMNMRFKVPPPETPSIGWRVEFRPCEVQLTDFENAAYVVFVVLLTRVIVSFHLTLLIPISKVNENMERAQRRDAVLNQKFYFRRGVATCNTPPSAAKACGGPSTNHEILTTAATTPLPAHDDDEKPSATQIAAANSCFVELTIDEIINGKPPDFPGLVPLMFQLLDSADVDVDTRCTIQQYLKFIQKRASGEVMTMARWMREFVQNHAEYRQDSAVSDSITYDMLKTMDDIANGRQHCQRLLGNFRTKTHSAAPSTLKDLQKINEAILANGCCV